ncbi:RNA-binding cell elongation regulator Jag/EloR [Aerococcaceae bacterium WGS1372]
MLEHSTTVRAETVDKAIEKGLLELNISSSEADIHVISEGKKGLFGFGKQDAVVEITMKNNLSLSEITQQLEEEVRNEQSETVKVTEEVVEVSEDLDIEEAEPNQIVEKIEPAEEKTAEKAENNFEPAVQFETTKVQASQTNVNEENSETSNEPQETSDHQEGKAFQDEMSIEEASQKVARYIETIIKEYGAQADVDYEISRSQVSFNIDTDKSGLVIGKHGKIINSLQILSQTYFQTLYRRRTSILLNVGDYRDRRANILRQIAQRTAEDVLKSKHSVILDPLPAYERKQIHAHLAKIDNIRTHSEGKEPNRYLVVEYRD